MAETLDDAIYIKLASVDAITDEVGSRIYRRWYRPSDTMPIITFARAGTTPLGSSGCDHPTEKITFNLNIWGSSIRDVRTLADLVKASLRGWSSTSPLASPMKLNREQDLHESPTDGASFGLARISQEYSVFS